MHSSVALCRSWPPHLATKRALEIKRLKQKNLELTRERENKARTEGKNASDHERAVAERKVKQQHCLQVGERGSRGFCLVAGRLRFVFATNTAVDSRIAAAIMRSKRWLAMPLMLFYLDSARMSHEARVLVRAGTVV